MVMSLSVVLGGFAIQQAAAGRGERAGVAGGP